MTPNFSPFNALAAVGICAALAMLGTEIDAQRPSVIRYEYAITLPDPPSDDDGDSPSTQDDHQPGHHHDPHDDYSDGPPPGTDPNDTIPM